MNKTAFNAIVDKTIADTALLLKKKNIEYSGEDDCFANFKRNAEKNGQTVLDVWQTYWGKHIDSINTYMTRVKNKATEKALDSIIQRAIYVNNSGGDWKHLTNPEEFKKDINTLLPTAVKEINDALSEPIAGRFHDNINYSLLCLGILEELEALTRTGQAGTSSGGCCAGVAGEPGK